MYAPSMHLSSAQVRLCNHRQTGNPVLCSQNLEIEFYAADELVAVGSPDEAAKTRSHPCFALSA